MSTDGGKSLFDSILVTGSNRSGTSWVGKMLCLSDEAFPVWEPFNHLDTVSALFSRNPLERHYQRLLPEQERAMRKFISDKILVDIVRMTECAEGFGGKLRKTGAIIRKSLSFFSGKMIPLFKDPIALMSAEWIEVAYNAGIVLTVRHPAAYVSSMKRLNWKAPVEDFLEQQHLMDTLPPDLQRQVRRHAESGATPEHFRLEDSALCWKVFYSVVDNYRRDHPDWLVVRWEDLCHDYIGGFGRLYTELGLAWDRSVEAKIDSWCGRRNAVTQGSKVHELKQDSRTLRDLWKEGLSSDECARIREITTPVWELYYDDGSWT